ncbi:phospholipase [Candidatus Woesearchaeota archaeon]|nr:phospholipase [Candidatus Woesearchaeota archaeon]
MIKNAYLLNRLTLVILLVLVSGCNISGSIVGQKITTVVKDDDGRIEAVYFCPRDDCSGRLAELISEAKTKAYCAFFDLDLEEVISALSKSEADVRLVVDTDNYEFVEELDFAKQDNRSAFMHNKFCIIDDKIISGSFNPTFNGAEKNNNNMIVIKSKVLAGNYEDEFDELWNGEFGKGKKVENPIVYLNGSKIENYFCPEDECGERIEEALEEAKKSIHFLVFSFTHTGIANEIVMRMYAKVDVKGVFEKRGTGSQYSRYRLMDFQGADVRKDNNSGVMHHKVFIIDNKTVITGSFNPSKNADTRNDENILIIHDKEVAEIFLNEFKFIWESFSEE